MAKLINDLIDLNVWGLMVKNINSKEEIAEWKSITGKMNKEEKNIYMEKNGVMPSKYKSVFRSFPNLCAPSSYKLNSKENLMPLADVLAHKKYLESTKYTKENGFEIIVMLSFIVVEELTGINLCAKDLDAEKEGYDSVRGDELLNTNTYIEMSPSGKGYHVFYEVPNGYTLKPEVKANCIDTMDQNWVSMTVDIYNDAEVMKATGDMIVKSEEVNQIKMSTKSKAKLNLKVSGDKGNRVIDVNLAELKAFDASKFDKNHDARMRGLRANGMVIAEYDPFHIKVICSNIAEHEDDPSGSYYLPANGTYSSTFVCNHEHCKLKGVSIKDLDAAIDIKEHRLTLDDFSEMVGEFSTASVDNFPEMTKKILKKAAEEKLNLIDVDELIELIIGVTKAKKTLVNGAYKVYVQEVKKAEKESEKELTQDGLVDLFLADVGAGNIHKKDGMTPYVYELKGNGVWAPCHLDELEVMMDKFLKHKMFMSPTTTMINALSSLAVTRMKSLNDVIPPERNTINFINGVVHFEDGAPVLKAHKREDYDTRQIPHVYDPDATCPVYDEYLHSCFIGCYDAEEIKQFLNELGGQGLTTMMRPRTFTVFVGDGDNGKGVFLVICEMIVGADNASHAMWDKLGDRFQAAEMDNKLFNLSAETKQTAERINTFALKVCSSGEPLSVEKKGKDPHTMYSRATLIQSSNHDPMVDDIGDSVRNRMRIIDWPNSFTRYLDKDNKVPNPKRIEVLEEKLEKEAPGIINRWIKAWALAEQKGEYMVPPSSLKAFERIRVISTPVIEFVDSCVDIKKSMEGSISLADLWSEYKDWASLEGLNNYQRGTKTELRQVIRKIGFGVKQEGNGSHTILGLELVNTGNLKKFGVKSEKGE